MARFKLVATVHNFLICQLPENLIEYVRLALNHYQASRAFSEEGWPTE